MRAIVLNILLISLVACNGFDGNEKKQITNVPNIKQADTAIGEPIKQIPENNLISDENVEEKLLAFGKENPETKVLIKTSKGTIKVRLYKDTPLHRANFILLAKSGYFDGSVFTRVAKNFIAQGGGADKDTNVNIIKSIGNYTIPAEIRPNHFHKKGAIAAARGYENNPKKRSDACDFYFVEGTLFNEPTLDKYEELNGYNYSAEQREYYKSNPGAAHIDGEHTVFGEVIEGFSVIPQLTSVATDSKDWPLEDIYIEKVEVLE